MMNMYGFSLLVLLPVVVFSAYRLATGTSLLSEILWRMECATARYARVGRLVHRVSAWTHNRIISPTWKVRLGYRAARVRIATVHFIACRALVVVDRLNSWSDRLYWNARSYSVVEWILCGVDSALYSLALELNAIKKDSYRHGNCHRCYSGESLFNDSLWHRFLCTVDNRITSPIYFRSLSRNDRATYVNRLVGLTVAKVYYAINDRAYTTGDCGNCK